MKPDRRFGTERERSVARSDESVAAETETGLGQSEFFQNCFCVILVSRCLQDMQLVKNLSNIYLDSVTRR